MNLSKRFFIVVGIVSGLCGCDHSEKTWKETLNDELPLMGHRNWIVIADSAYPKQSAAGIKTIHTGESQLEVLRAVLAEIEQADHVQAVVLLDQEMEFVSEDDAPGMEAYRTELNRMLTGKQISVMPHEEIIKQLDSDSSVFNVLMLKTDLTLPYTSVFLKLDCGYWNEAKERRLRERLESASLK